MQQNKTHTHTTHTWTKLSTISIKIESDLACSWLDLTCLTWTPNPLDLLFLKIWYFVHHRVFYINFDFKKILYENIIDLAYWVLGHPFKSSAPALSLPLTSAVSIIRQLCETKPSTMYMRDCFLICKVGTMVSLPHFAGLWWETKKTWISQCLWNVPTLATGVVHKGISKLNPPGSDRLSWGWLAYAHCWKVLCNSNLWVASWQVQ